MMTISLESKMFLSANLLAGAANIWLKPKAGLISLVAGGVIGGCVLIRARHVADAGSSAENKFNEIISASFPKYGVLLLSAAALCITLNRIGISHFTGPVLNFINQNIIPFSTIVLGYYLGKILMSNDSSYHSQGKTPSTSSSTPSGPASPLANSKTGSASSSPVTPKEERPETEQPTVVQLDDASDSEESSEGEDLSESKDLGLSIGTPKLNLSRELRASELIARETIHNPKTVRELALSSEGRKQLLVHGAKLLGSSVVDFHEAQQVMDTVIEVRTRTIESLDGDDKSIKEAMAQLQASIKRFEQIEKRDAIQYANQERFIHNEVDTKELDQAVERYNQTYDITFKTTIRTLINQINELIETERRFIGPLNAFLEPIYFSKDSKGKTLKDPNGHQIQINYFQALEMKGIINSEQSEYFQRHLAAILEHSEKQFSHMQMIQRNDSNAEPGSPGSSDGVNLRQALELLIEHTNPASLYALIQSMNKISGRIEEFYTMILTLQRSRKDDLSRPFKAAEKSFVPDFPARGADNLYITPTQRAPRYVMLFAEIEKSLEKLNMPKTLASIHERTECAQKCTAWANFRLGLI
jgi:hypothetical protein